MRDVTRLMESGTQSRARHNEKCCVVRERFAPFVRFPSRSELEAQDAGAAWRSGTGSTEAIAMKASGQTLHFGSKERANSVRDTGGI